MYVCGCRAWKSWDGSSRWSDGVWLWGCSGDVVDSGQVQTQSLRHDFLIRSEMVHAEFCTPTSAIYIYINISVMYVVSTLSKIGYVSFQFVDMICAMIFLLESGGKFRSWGWDVKFKMPKLEANYACNSKSWLEMLFYRESPWLMRIMARFLMEN